MTTRHFILFPIFFFAAFGHINSTAIAGNGIEWGHFRFIPSLAVSENYSDNIYLASKNKTEDYVATLTPELTLDAAIVPRNYFSLKYRGDFLSYSETDNFKEDHHLGSLSFNGETAKGSHFVAGISAQETAIQPFSDQEQSKDYTLKHAYVDVLAKLGKVTEVGAQYSRQDREFNEQEFYDDDFIRNTWDFHVLYTRSSIWPLLIQYRYESQDNNDLGTINSDFHTYTLFLGARWRSDSKFSGAFRVGYKKAEFDRPGADDYYGYAADTLINYAFSEFTNFTHTAQSMIGSPTRSARESGEYYINKRVGLSITHRRWERITSQLDFLYNNRDYGEIQSSDSVRSDDYYRVGLSISYTMRKWITFSLSYRYQDNRSDIEDEDYSENQIKLGIALSL